MADMDEVNYEPESADQTLMNLPESELRIQDEQHKSLAQTKEKEYHSKAI